jgi:two-component system, NarL family, sensor histidine kinase DevS
VKVEDELSVRVVDDGQGLPADITGSGLTNLWRRAEQVGGSFSIESPPTGGTVLTWSAPLS